MYFNHLGKNLKKKLCLLPLKNFHYFQPKMQHNVQQFLNQELKSLMDVCSSPEIITVFIIKRGMNKKFWVITLGQNRKKKKEKKRGSTLNALSVYVIWYACGDCSINCLQQNICIFHNRLLRLVQMMRTQTEPYVQMLSLPFFFLISWLPIQFHFFKLNLYLVHLLYDMDALNICFS